MPHNGDNEDWNGLPTNMGGAHDRGIRLDHLSTQAPAEVICRRNPILDLATPTGFACRFGPRSVRTVLLVPAYPARLLTRDPH